MTTTFPPSSVPASSRSNAATLVSEPGRGGSSSGTSRTPERAVALAPPGAAATSSQARIVRTLRAGRAAHFAVQLRQGPKGTTPTHLDPAMVRPTDRSCSARWRSVGLLHALAVRARAGLAKSSGRSVCAATRALDTRTPPMLHTGRPGASCAASLMLQSAEKCSLSGGIRVALHLRSSIGAAHLAGPDPTSARDHGSERESARFLEPCPRALAGAGLHGSGR